MPREKNMSRITAIHHPLGDVDASTGDVGLFVQISDFTDRPAVNTHSDSKFRMTFSALLISKAHKTGASGLVRKTSAPPSPVGKRISLPSASAIRNWTVPRTISLSP